ncbi:hypothetical protein HPP92_024615 [Vanilla planifolia]|uniref:Uncharacterized protein n=1 Tax=Vanilla planifolia TaxID=51239 RepID=A0A835PSK5_VANPL|nr:hypothetical protein HPP92_024615 [Vanilla planifolia]
MVRTDGPANNDHQSDGGSIRLFRKAPPGIRLERIDPHPKPKKKPRIIPGEEIDEKSKMFRRQIKSVAVNGPDVVAAAILNCEKSWARWEAKEFAAKEAAKKEEERVAELKRIRGEKWLPSVARAMQEK